MSNPLYKSYGSSNIDGLMQKLNQLKSSVSNPQAMIQQMLNSGRITQAQYNNAVRQAQALQKMMTK